ncbi:MAG TPA: DUF4012 domain-containing protein [Candidatus Paceibacterota bacterium]|nr:DUF4012 domain-containing protein [Candidatus Paceibacterota bacterium]
MTRKGRNTLLGLVPWLLGAGVVVAGLLYISQQGLRESVVRNSDAAITHLLDAQQSVLGMDWSAAYDSFVAAEDSFSDAGGLLGGLARSLSGLLQEIPGFSDVGTGAAITRAGELLSSAGARVTEALAALLTDRAAGGVEDLDLSPGLERLEQAFMKAANDVQEAVGLLEGVNPEDIPLNYRDQFTQLKQHLPELQRAVDRGKAGTIFARGFLGADRAHRYLVLFQNSSELRPTGGFPGTYGLLTVEDGRVTDWRADDIYNPDGQIPYVVIPPAQMQHLTPGWGMRDAAWFADFTVSAQQVQEYWRLGGGVAVDGVLAVQPSVLVAILQEVGPVEMSDYGITVTPENLLPTLQQEIEEQRPTGQPKQVIADLAPIVLDRLAALPADSWARLFGVFADALTTRDIQMSFSSDASLQGFVDQEGWSGRVVQIDGDFLLVNVANIGGAKADEVTDTSLKLESRVEQGTLVHRLTVTRQHNGGSTPYAFYNKTNKSWIRVLVPQGSTLRGVSGNAHPTYRPLLDYTDPDVRAKRDADLVAFEATMQRDERWDATVFEESGKTAFGFWMEVKPGETGQVQIEYAVPASAFSKDYMLYVQRQPGIKISNLEITLDKPGFVVTGAEPAVVEWPDSWRLHDSFDRDLVLKATLR